MADGSLTGAGDKLATDELSTLNGADVTGSTPRVKAERTKVGFGSDGDFRDVDSAHPLPASDSVAQAKLDVLHSDVGVAGDSSPALATNATGLIGWLRKIVDVLTGGLSTTATIAAQAPWSRRSVTSGSFAATALRGLAIRETSGTASALVNIYSGTDNTGTLLVPIALAPGESARETFGPSGIGQSGVGTNITNLFVEVASGAVAGSVFV